MELYVYDISDPALGRDRAYASFVPHSIVFERGLTARQVVGEYLDGVNSRHHERFAVNREFANWLQAFVGDAVTECPSTVGLATKRVRGSEPIVDLRAPLRDGVVALQEILGFVEFSEGVVRNYRPNPDYKVLTVDGVTSLNPWMEERLLSALVGISESES